MRIISHALLMVKKTIRNYLLLSVTALISFSVMFVYLMYTDSNIYNKYREVMGADSDIIVAANAYSNETIKELNMLTEQLEKYEDTNYYYINQTHARNVFGGQECEVQVLPNYTWAMFEIVTMGEDKVYDVPSRVMVNGKKEISLKDNEAIVSKKVYDYLEREYGDDKHVKLVFTCKDGSEILKEYSVVGMYEKKEDRYSDPEECTEGDMIYISDGFVTKNCNIINISLVIKSDSANEIHMLIQNMGLASVNCYKDRNEAIAEKKMVVANKYIIAIVLFVLLGINLYSSFLNALNDRKFEIGIKRAIGASKFDIMLQYLIEGIFVMLINIMLSVMIAIAVMVAYKYIRYIVDGYVFVVTMTKQSVILYFLFSFFLSLLFSLIFAYKSTCVEIIKYLKEEL